jgi:Metallo-beta-lactamase superfamily
VGQGDSLFVVSPMGETLLIDGGGAFGGFPGHEEARGSDPGEEAVSPYLWSRGFKKIDVVALTHAHQDHLEGLNAILENFSVGRLWIGREVNNPALARLEALARERNISLEYETRGKRFSLDEVQGEFLWPEISTADAAAAAKNNDSLVLRLKYRNRTLLLPGDAGTIRNERDPGIENGPRWSSAYFAGWRPAGNFLLCGMHRISGGDYCFKTCGNAKSEPKQSAITKSPRLLAIRDFSCIAGARMLRCRLLRVWRETILGKRVGLRRRSDQNLWHDAGAVRSLPFESRSNKTL